MITIEPQGQTMKVAALDQQAAAQGLYAGQTLAGAKSLAPDVIVHPHDPDSDRATMEALAVWANQFTPVVHIEDQRTLLMDVTGCQRLFGGEESLVMRACEGLHRKGFHARAALADTPGAAWALAKAGPAPTGSPEGDAKHEIPYDMLIAPPGQTMPAIAALPVWSLRIEPRATRELAYVGIHAVKDLLHLPRSAVAGRFGDAALKRIDQATGDLPEPLIAYQPPRALEETVQLPAPTDRRDQLEAILDQALTEFCRHLDQGGNGIRRLHVTFDCSGGTSPQGKTAVTETLSLSKITRSLSHLKGLVRVLTDQLKLPGPFESVTVWAQEIETLDDTQQSLFDDDVQDDETLVDFLDRLIVRLGKNAVVTVQPLCDYQPEYAFRYVPLDQLLDQPGKTMHAGDKKNGKRKPDKKNRNKKNGPPVTGRSPTRPSSQHPASQHPASQRPSSQHPAAQAESAPTSTPASAPISRPTRLLHRPREIGAAFFTAPSPSQESMPSQANQDMTGAPRQLRFDGRSHDVTFAVGPERIETGWWRGPHTRRDYYRIRTRNGQRLWIFQNRDTNRWFLHGWF